MGFIAWGDKKFGYLALIIFLFYFFYGFFLNRGVNIPFLNSQIVKAILGLVMIVSFVIWIAGKMSKT